MRRQHHKAAFALIQVTIIVALVTVMSLVMLSESSLQAQTNHNALLAMQAESLAESGVNLATYYLLNPWNSPTPQAAYWAGGGNISLGSGVSGTISQVTVTAAARPDLSKPQEYVICSTGTATSLGSSLSRTLNARVAVNPGVQIGTRSVMSRGNLTLPLNAPVTGDVMVDGTLKNLTLITGNVQCRLLDPLSTGTILNGLLGVLPVAQTVPGPANPVLYTPSYAYTDGHVYARSEIAAASIGPATYGATAGNPAGIHHHTGTLTINDNTTVNGTLIVEGDVIFAGNNIVINAQASSTGGYPALITTGDVRTNNGRTITINGSAWVGKTIRSNVAGSFTTRLNINGALLFGSAGGNIATNAGLVTINWNANRTVLPDMDQVLKRSVAIVYWNKTQ